MRKPDRDSETPQDALELETTAPAETERLGRSLAALLPVGAVVALHGELATGKTCFVRGMASRFARGEAIHSPTFTLVNEYGHDRKLYHLDLYRLSGPEEVIALGCEELFESDGVCVVEWADRAAAILPARRVDVFFAHRGGDARAIRVVNLGVLPPDWRETLRADSASI
ncbi:MAG TPA: tRNA (adenosine(37)-N6)-threonylcarbamoyltransferase complex ATPase subunit type 1 TsaE [Candidatus Hydrogenedentes bacterium]|nr:tRNA (adenosine(37)-N6)-threonylcarbamoyltransferase complex ATPase subunit type 1 TsaE [Candidatus Hydrogenedentota bacterium]HNT89249.1 tRNA (adenosine(37)-N6)-threonylcarbamoyltransferase complex ATPase subunit type 1 TsaE [Candidatus Hydrogenedentota bacterium]